MRRLNPKPSLFTTGLGKSELLNTKQIQMPKIQNPKHFLFYLFSSQKKRYLRRECFEYLNLELRYCLGFRILRLGF